jgi:hypothetical protein
VRRGRTVALGARAGNAGRDDHHRGEPKRAEDDHRHAPSSIRAEKLPTEHRTGNRADREREIHGTERGCAVTLEIIGRDREQHGQLHRFADAGRGPVHQHVRESARDDGQRGTG